ncbi:MAG: 50S ribosomal protein L18 [Bacteroidetes bacterium]|jgi:large subunit ribosomal protein L18|nr:50S ribosomal protein L18 [Bacteroidota bacterium]MBT5527904.1 50S ribosomal protein L18 [Cytophagia bacterium]MBT3424921.1 50S ribosomal protein L18 [Bacteroidota bacterium]MBT3933959.1 50S ribosomal protein L18 [Bacteroidota bacterium]MBT4338242.1 50S ribosomal protein L18 [Bacteroidota bacterium]
MSTTNKKSLRRSKIKMGIRKKIKGTQERPRLSVFRSNNEIYGQLIDDVNGSTVVAISSIAKDVERKGKTKTEVAKLMGIKFAEKAKEAKIDSIVFDRNGYLYHGRIKAFAEGVREGGLQF